MTPGQEALTEAMRLEQARIYGERQVEHQAAPDNRRRSVAPAATVHDIEERRAARRTA